VSTNILGNEIKYITIIRTHHTNKCLQVVAYLIYYLYVYSNNVHFSDKIHVRNYEFLHIDNLT